MPIPNGVSDGNFSVAMQNGPPEYELPFAHVGDFTSWIARVKMRVDQASYVRPQSFAQQQFGNLGKAYRVDASPAQDVGGGLLEWTETFAALPQSRDEYGSFRYNQQAISFDATGMFVILERGKTYNARVHYDFSLQTPLPPLIAPYLFTFPIAGLVLIEQVGGWGNFIPGVEVQAQDSESKIWMGRIFSRKTIYIVWGNYTAAS